MTPSYFQDRHGGRAVPSRAIASASRAPTSHEARQKLHASLDWILGCIDHRKRLLPPESFVRDRQLDDLYRRADAIAVRLVADYPV